MSDKVRRIIAIIALVFVGLFSVAFVMYLYDSALFNGAIGYVALFTGGIGLALFLVVYFSRKSTLKYNSEVEEQENNDENKDEEKKD